MRPATRSRELGSILLLSLATMGAYATALIMAGLAMSSY
jgi:hypothetical protein